MPNPTRIEVNCETGVATEVELTDEEVAELAVQAAEAEARRAEEEAAQAAILAAKESAHSKLAALGLTEEEIKALTNN